MADIVQKIGSWRFDPEGALLRQGDTERPLEERAARVLAILCRSRGDIVSKDRLLAEVWQGRRVSPNSVAIVIGDLRRALDDDPSDPLLIVTVGKRGYRLTPLPMSKPAVTKQRSPLGLAALLVVPLVCALLGWAVLDHNSPTVDLVVAVTRNETGDTRYDALARAMSAVLIDGAAHIDGARVIPPREVASAERRRLMLTSRLIIWNGAPEVAMTAVDDTRHAVLWSAFATNRGGNLARDATAKLKGLSLKLRTAQ